MRAGQERGQMYRITDIIGVRNLIFRTSPEAVIFDLDDTLYPERDYVRSGYRAIAAAFSGVPGMADELWQVFLRGGKAIDEVFAEHGMSGEKDRALKIYRFHKPDITLYDGVEQMLRDLKKAGFKLGIVTDGRPEGQRAKLESLGLEHLRREGVIDEVTVTDELGGTQFRKPCSKAFELMKERLGVTDFGRMVYVGDNRAKDFTAPDLLGMNSIWFDNPEGLYR